MNVSLYIANRLGLKSGREGRSPGVWVGYVGVALAILIMLLAIFVVNGFKRDITGKLLGFNAAITLYAPDNMENPAFTSGLRYTDSIKSLIANSIPEASASLLIRQPAILKTDTDFQGIVLKGISADASEWDFYAANLIEGNIPTAADGANVILLSAVSASKMGLKTGDKVLTHFLDGNSVRSRNLKITGIFDTHFHDFDNAVALTSIKMLQHLNHVDSLTGTGIEIRGLRIDDSDRKASELHAGLINATVSNPTNPMLYNVVTISENCVQYLSWLDLLDTNVITIIILMACVAGFTLISSLFIIILERVNTIGLLKAMGATNTQIRTTFIYMAERIVLKGIIIGNILAIAISFIQEKWHILPLDAEAYYINYVPIELNWYALAIVDISAIIISALVLILPSHLIARLSPSVTLRYE